MTIAPHAERAPLVFAIRRYEAFADALATAGEMERGRLHQELFPDGEALYRYDSGVRNRTVLVVGGMVDAEAEMEIFDLAAGAVDLGAARLVLILPWFSHATMERATHPGEVVTAKNRARLLSAIPRAPLGNQVLMLDLHSEGIPQYFEGGVQTIHVYGEPFITRAARELGGEDFVLASTDAGRAKWVESLAKRLHVDFAVALKRRESGSRTETLWVAGPVEGRHVILYDDMIRTGGSLIGAAEAYRRAGAGRISVITTHGLFPGRALERLEASGLFDHVVASDSHLRVHELPQGFLRVVPVASLFLPYLHEEAMRVG